MSRIDSFFLPPEAWREPFSLQDGEARHALKVLRLGSGARLRCFDGLGREGLFVLERAGGEARLSLESERFTPRPEPQTWLALGFNKSARRGWLLEKAVELGAAGILFWEAARGQGGMPTAPKETWKAQLVAGAKQCGNPWLPEIEVVAGGAAGLAARCRDFERKSLLWESAGEDRILAPTFLTGSGRRVFVLGPEGGLTQPEAQYLQEQGFAPVSLGPRPLRWETAALACLTLAWWGATLTKSAQNPASPGGPADDRS